MEKVLVSACLLGDPVRYNGGDKRCDHDTLRRWVSEGRVVPICPEVAGGLQVPRAPAEIVGGAGGARVLAGAARVVDVGGRDVSAYFVRGAELALARARGAGARVAVLKEGSPSCGTGVIHDGSFSSTRVPGLGVAAELLRQSGFWVFSEDQLAEAARLIERLEAGEPG